VSFFVCFTCFTFPFFGKRAVRGFAVSLFSRCFFWCLPALLALLALLFEIARVPSSLTFPFVCLPALLALLALLGLFSGSERFAALEFLVADLQSCQVN
jgi:hypothetical protein